MNTTAENSEKKTARLRQGTVIKDKMDKTVIVEVVRQVRHHKYNKYLKRRVRYPAHDEKNECGVGDVVVLEETRPMSKSKRWRVKSVAQKALEV